ncbi:MAG: SLBB domain-containing protein [Bacteroidetes bacterium]|nr:SLBB domain-containing protein [Bacteroidota bacterium]
MRQKLEKYLQDPSVRIYLESFKVTLLGEIKLPGVYQVKNEKLTLTDALGLAGDMTIFGDRKSVMVIRNVKGQKVFTSLDLTTRDIFQSDFYYLRPGDVVYVPAGKGRIATADTFYRIAPLVISVLSLIAILTIRVN